MTHTEIQIDNEARAITFEDITYDIGVSLLSFIDSGVGNDHPYKHFQANKKTLKELQECYKELVIDCLYLKQTNKQTKAPDIHPSRGRTAGDVIRYSPPVRRLYYSDLNAPETSMCLHYRTVETDSGEIRLIEVYTLSDIAAACYIEFMKMIQFGLSIRKCQNCGLFFISKGDYDTKYCDRIPQGQTRSCQQIGAVKTFQAKVDDNPILTEYNKIYRRFHSRKRNGIITPDQFNLWKKHAAQVRDRAVKDDLTLEQFIAKIEGISI